MEIDYHPKFWSDMKDLFDDGIYYRVKRGIRNVKQFPREVKWFFQRARRGWADSDTWAIYYHLGKVIPQMLRHMANHTASFNPDYTFEEWKAKLISMADKIESYNLMSEMPDGWTGEKEEEAYKITQEGLREMTEIFGHLWD